MEEKEHHSLGIGPGSLLMQMAVEGLLAWQKMAEVALGNLHIG